MERQNTPPVPDGHVRLKYGLLPEGYRDIPKEHFDPSQHALHDESDRVAPADEVATDDLDIPDFDRVPRGADGMHQDADDR